MTTLETHHDKWDKERISRQFSQLVTLSIPIILQRLGIMTLGIVDTAMVARFSSTEVAFQGIANSAIVSTLIVASIGAINAKHNAILAARHFLEIAGASCLDFRSAAQCVSAPGLG